MNKKYIIGCGGHGRVVLDSFFSRMDSVDGIIDPSLEIGTFVFGVKVVGNDSFLEGLNPSEVLLLNGVGVSKSLDKRREIFLQFEERGFNFIGTNHSTVILGRDCGVSISAQVMAGVILQNRVSIGKNTVVNTGSRVDHDCFIGNHSFISPGVTICGGVTVGESVFIGAGSVILPGLELGSESIIGAGSVVTKNVRSKSKVFGNPARAVI